MTVGRKWVLVCAGTLLAAGLLLTGYRAHRVFRDSLVETFVGQQSMFIRALANSVRDYVGARERDVSHVIGELLRDADVLHAAPQRLAALHAAHLQGFESVTLHDRNGELIAASPAELAEDKTRVSWVRDTILTRRSSHAVFVSDSFVGRDFKTLVFLFMPFEVPGAGWCYVVGGLQIEDYLSAHLAAWKGRSMVVMLADDDGGILSLLNTTHEQDQRMKLGNLLNLDDPCVKCHTRDEFDDVRRALHSADVEHSLFVPPGGSLQFNRAALAFDVHNERWVMSLVSPFEGVESAVDRQLRVQLFFAGFALLALVGLGYAMHRVVELEHVSETNEALRISTTRLAEANRVKDLFTDIVRHDLMSPLSAAIGYAAILDGAACGPEAAKILSPLQRTLGRARAIVESAATLSQLEDVGSIDVREGDLGELMDAVLGQQAASLRAAGLAVVREIDGRFPVRMNQPLLEQVFANLLSNAGKYAAAGGKVEVSIRDGGGRWVARVRDWGEGIPDAAKERVFERLARLNKEGIKGSGLGLAIVRRVVALHGGEVWVEDNPEGGSDFNVALPKARKAVPE
jgi:signal transduction histidine kinase